MFVQTYKRSAAIDSLEVDQDGGLARVFFNNGNGYLYSGVNKKQIKSLLTNPLAQSFGKWVNKNCVQSDSTTVAETYTA